MDMWFDEYDICWCADSDRCENTECFRHFCHQVAPASGPNIFTCSHLMGTEYCELTKEGED